MDPPNPTLSVFAKECTVAQELSVCLAGFAREKTRIKRRLECFAKTDVQPLEILSSILKKNDLWIANLGHGFQLESNLRSTPIPKLCSDAEKMVENRLKVATIN